MIIKSILEELKTSSHPVAKALHKTSQSKAICIGFNQGMKLKDHKAHQSTRIVVMSGEIKYLENGKEQVLSKYEMYDIPVEITHAVHASEDSLIMLLQG